MIKVLIILGALVLLALWFGAKEINALMDCVEYEDDDLFPFG